MTNVAYQLERNDRRLALAIVVLGVIVQLPALWIAVPSKATINALRILNGEIPYRDFWTMYAPGHFYVIAGLIKLFGHVWAQGIGSFAFIAADGAFLFVITRRLGLDRRIAALIGAAFIAILWGHAELSAYEPVLLFLLAALDRLVRYLAGDEPRQLVLAGLLLGVGAWFKHDVAFYGSLGGVAGLSLAWLIAAGRRPTNWVSPLHVALRLGSGAAAGALPVLILLAAFAGADAWQDLVVFPAGDFRVVRGEAYPSFVLNWAPIAEWLARPLDVSLIVQVTRYVSRWPLAHVPEFVFAAATLTLILMRRRLNPVSLGVLTISLATMPFFWASAHVQQNTNFYSLWVFSILVGTLAWTARGVGPFIRVALAIVFAIELAAFLVRPARQVAEFVYFWPNYHTLEFPRVSGILMPDHDYGVYEPIVSFIRANVPEGEPIYSGLGRHDSVVINSQIFYVLADRPVASRYNELHPGIVDREEVQREIIDDLERLQVRCIVIWEFGWPVDVMNGILASRRLQIPELGSTVLDEYIRREFQEIARYGEYALAWRKGHPILVAPRSVMQMRSNP